MGGLSQTFFNSGEFQKIVMSLANMAESVGVDLRSPPLEIKEYSLKTDRWPAHYEPLKIAVASDFHVGCLSVSTDDIKDLVKRMNSLNADIILLPGDFLNSPYQGHDGVYVEPKIVAESLKDLSAPCGVYAVLGNHDVHEMYNSLMGVGIITFNNASMTVSDKNKRFNLVGVADSTTVNANCKIAFSQVNADIPTIAMTHNPQAVHDMPEGLVTVVAGHTHAGQFTIPLITPEILGCPDRGLNYGQVERNGNPLLVTSGVGTSIMPFRNVAPEIAVLTIEHAPDPEI